MILNAICGMVNNDNMSNMRRYAMVMITSFRIIIVIVIIITLLRCQHPAFSIRQHSNKTIKIRGIELHEECIVMKCLFRILRIACATAFWFFLYHAIFAFMILPKCDSFQWRTQMNNSIRMKHNWLGRHVNDGMLMHF